MARPEPIASLKRWRATDAQTAAMEATPRTIRTCQGCRYVYTRTHAAYACEQAHLTADRLAKDLAALRRIARKAKAKK